MELNRAIDVVKKLANGTDPTTGEVFADDSPYNNPEIIRALFIVLGEFKRAKRAGKQSVEEKQIKNIESGKPRNAGLPWSDALKAELATLYNQDLTTKRLASHFERTEGAILSELEHQGLLDRDMGKNR